ncbi:hypothetical protein PCE1_002350 [Barthelona sp. PCE]
MHSAIKITGAVQNYAWGIPGLESSVAVVSGANDDTLPYAEYWLGVHPKGMAHIEETNEKLSSFLSNSSLDMEFLFKILSVNSALSIQLHPTEELARELHESDPAHYPDPNSKPEMAVAITTVKLMCGFRCFTEIKENMAWTQNTALNELFDIFQYDAEEQTIVKNIVITLLDQDKTTIDAAIDALPEEHPLYQQVSEFNSIYPNDPGVLMCMLLNVYTLSPNDAVYIPPLIPHAYISGEMIEVMRNSDNVVRAGLTPKFIDKRVLCDHCDYTCGFNTNNVIVSEMIKGITTFTPPTQYFKLHQLKKSADPYVFEYEAPAIMLILHGSTETNQGNFNEHDSYLLLGNVTFERFSDNFEAFIVSKNI